MFDVAIVGGGPAGASCAAFCASAGLKTLVLEREKFPREKVCGDCLNPSCWPVLQRLQLSERLRAQPHRIIEAVEFIGTNERALSLPLPTNRDPEFVIKRSLFDQLLLVRARELGAEVCEERTVTALARNGRWQIAANDRTFSASVLVAADGRNSTVARLLKIFPRVSRDRVALQAHVPLPPDFGSRIVLQFLPEGYSGQAPVTERELNLCLVGPPPTMARLRSYATHRFSLPDDQAWRTITPLTRLPISSTGENLFFIGDVARVVEPFTGEGIFYALRSGELAAQAIIHKRPRDYAAAQARMYRGRLWINRLARAAVLSPRIASVALRMARYQPAVLRLLTAKITLGSRK
jgi:menaquinone-9 beta-reductase